MKNLLLILLSFTVSAVSCQNSERISDWDKDVSYFDNQLRSNHKNLFHQISEADYKKSIDELKTKIDQFSDFDIVVGLSKISASIGDSHTFLHPEAATQHYVPLFISLFEEGFFVIRAKPAYTPILKGRLLRINETPVDKVYELIRSTISADQGNEMSYKFMVGSRLTSADLLLSLGIISDLTNFRLTVMTATGKEESIEVSSIDKDAFSKDDWVLILAENEADRPLSYQYNQKNYWQTIIPNSETLYFQYNKCENQKESSINMFADDLFETVSKQNIKKIIIDLRRNTGGNEKLNRPIISGLQRSVAENSDIKIIVLIGRATHSAACNLLLDLEKLKTPMTTIGEPARSKPNFYSENHFYTLPNSKIRGSVSELFRKDSFDGDDRLRIEPVIKIQVKFSDYVLGKDAALEKALTY